jgi:hypothetical protein
MLSTIFKTKPIIDEANKTWILDTFIWCFEQLDGDFFKHDSELILPNNSFYPGSSNSVEEMAETIFSNTMKYTGMAAWPIKLIPTERFIQKPMPQLLFESRLRGDNCNISYKVEGVDSQVPFIDIPFHSNQLNQPQDLIAYIVQIQANILINQHGIIAPGGKEVLAHTVDLVACFMGFGVIFANTAYQFKGGCGTCNNRNLNRQPALPELETVYALALFCVIKKIEIKQVKKELKSHLYKHFRQAYKEISLNIEQTNNPKYIQLIT